MDEAGAGRAGGAGGAAGTAAGSGALVMLHDYHLYGVAPLVRAALPGAFLQQFVHIPWAQSDAWLVLPKDMRDGDLRGAARQRHRRLPHAALRAQLPAGLRRPARPAGGPGAPHGHRRRPGGLGARLPGLHRPAGAAGRPPGRSGWRPRRRRCSSAAASSCCVRVDRLDLSKNIIRGFLAFDRFLDLHPEFRDRITFLALLQPSREDVEEYVTYRERVMRTVEQINTKHGNTDWMPIDVRIQDNFPQTLAAYRHYDALMVNAIFDGMNLVAKEGPILNTAGRRPHPLGEHRRVRGARRLRAGRQPLRHRAAGAGDPRGPDDGRRGSGARATRRSATSWTSTASSGGCRRSSPTSPRSWTPPAAEQPACRRRSRGGLTKVRSAGRSAASIREDDVRRGARTTPRSGGRRDHRDLGIGDARSDELEASCGPPSSAPAGPGHSPQVRRPRTHDRPRRAARARDWSSTARSSAAAACRPPPRSACWLAAAAQKAGGSPADSRASRLSRGSRRAGSSAP